MRTALVATLFVASLIIAGVLGIGGWSCHQPQKPNSGENVFGDRKEWKQDSIIAPTGDINAPSDLLDITQEQIQAIVDKTQTIYVWGEASYRDAFNRIWTFEFGDTGSGPMRTLNPAEKLIGWGLSPQGYIETETKK